MIGCGNGDPFLEWGCGPAPSRQHGLRLENRWGLPTGRGAHPEEEECMPGRDGGVPCIKAETGRCAVLRVWRSDGQDEIPPTACPI